MIFAETLCDKDLFTNGECDDETNTEECFFDFGDCCKFQIFVGECTNCICHEDNTRHTFWIYPNEIKIRDDPWGGSMGTNEKSILTAKKNQIFQTMLYDLEKASGLGTAYLN